MFQQVTPHVYYRMHEPYSDRSTVGYILGREKALLFEAGSSPAHAETIRRELAQQGLPLPSYVAVSHSHWDHAFGLCAWDVPTIAGRETNERLRHLQTLPWDEASIKKRVENKEEIQFCFDMMKREYGRTADVRVVPADVDFEGSLQIDLGGVRCRLLPVQGPHAHDSIVCLIPEDKFIFLGDSNGKDLDHSDWEFHIEQEDRLVETLMAIPYDPEKLAPYKAYLSSLPFTACIGGHAAPMTRDELFETLSI